jgi:4-alpha-glucanotransferase
VSSATRRLATHDKGPLAALAERAGLVLEWEDAQRRPQRVSADTARAVLDALGLPCSSAAQIRHSLAGLDAELSRRQLPPLITAEVDQAIALPSPVAKEGARYRLELEHGGTIDGILSAPRGQNALLSPIAEPGYHALTLNAHQAILAVAPRRCHAVEHPCWGIAVQAYGLRRPNDGGLGDFTALGDFARHAASRGAQALAVSPLHAMFTADPAKSSPYSPSSRRFINVLHIDPAAVLGDTAVRAAIAELGLSDEWARLHTQRLIDWPAVAHARVAVLHRLFERFAVHGATAQPALVDAFRAFCERGGRALEDHARFEALHAAQTAADPTPGHWRNWPAGLREAHGAAVTAFADAHRTEIDFHRFLQWLAARGLDDAQHRACEQGMRIGLIADLAVGCDSGGSDAWSCPHDMLLRLSIGAPPDLFNPAGQSWGLTTFSPHALRTGGFGPFIDMLRASFAHAGGVRIDHILGLRRLWLVPDGASARDGAYLRYPFDDLLRLIALESWRHRAIVVGEDLGTVPGGLRERLAETGLLGIRVLWFEREAAPASSAPASSAPASSGPASSAPSSSGPAPFKLPAQWDTHVAATTTTHDLPTVAGWWQGRDIDERMRIGHGPATDDDTPGLRARLNHERAQDRAALWAAFQQAGLAPAATEPPAPHHAPVDEAIAFVARTPALLVTVPLEDLTGTTEQPNLPGSTFEHPNWQRRTHASVDALFAEPTFINRLAIVSAERANAINATHVDRAAPTGAEPSAIGPAHGNAGSDSAPPRNPPL